MKKTVRQFVTGFSWIMMTYAANAQQAPKDDKQEEKIRSLISQMISADKVVYGKDEVIHVKFTVKNTGSRYGAEVAQLYVSDPVATVLRPAKELKSFEKVFLQPGESKRITLNLKIADLAFFDESKNDWNIEAGDFILQLGNSSGNISRTLKITVK
ncbi:fibronectin type III-like domain-contianing protein [Flavitalea flava]